MKKIRILQVCRLTPLWGMDLFAQISQAFTHPDYEITTVFLAGKAQPLLQKHYHGKVIFFELNRHRFHWRWQAFWRLRQLCRDQYFDIVICHHYKPTWIMHMVATTTSVGNLFSMHHNFGNFRRRRAQWWLQKFKKHWQFITVSQALGQELITAGVLTEKIHIIPNTIDIALLQQQQFSRTHARETLKLPSNAFVFGTLGRLVKDKGHEYLLSAFTALCARYPQCNNLHLIIIGNGELETHLRNLFANHHLSNRLHLVTEIATQGAHYLRALDIFVFPSQQEAFGLVLLEAMCAKLPIIGTNVGGIPEAAGPQALLVPPRKVEALTTAMATYFELSAPIRKEIGENHYRHLLQNFSLECYQAHFQRLVTTNREGAILEKTNIT